MRRIIYSAALALCLTSCFKEEQLNPECDIIHASVHIDAPEKVFYNASDTVAPITPDYASDVIEFKNVQFNTDLTAMAPVFVLSKGATITPASGTVRDFSSGAQEYTVTSEDGSYHRVYKVKFTKPQSFYEYNFENYYLSEHGKYYIWSDNAEGETPNWCTANAGFGVARSSAKPMEYPSIPDENGYEGACVKLQTVSTGSWGVMTNKRLAAGNLFLGSFDLSKALTQTLQSTHFGLPTAKKPLRFAGYYMYKPGEQMQDAKGKFIEGEDDAAIYAVVFKNHDADGNSVYLTGEDIMTNPLRVGMAKLYDIKHNEDWNSFDVEFDYWEEIDMDLLHNLGYSLAILCSASKNGDLYEGALGSTLWIDKLSIITEEEE